jgi:hypothetical protein
MKALRRKPLSERAIAIERLCTTSSSAASKTRTVLPLWEAAAMLFGALMASSQINIHKADEWKTLDTKPIDESIDLAA